MSAVNPTDWKTRSGASRVTQAEVPERVPGFAGGLTAFGSVKAVPRPWPDGRHDIRRTYLPTGADETWPELVDHWRTVWEGA